MNDIAKIVCTLCVMLSFFGCFNRELDDDDNYVNLKRTESLKDNETLRFRTFRIEDNNGFLIFGNNNEVSIDGIARFPVYFYIDNGNKQATIDLSGCVYEYTSAKSEIIFRKAILRSKHLKKDLTFDVVFYFSKLPNTESKSELFDFRMKRILLSESKTLSVGEKTEMNGQLVGFMSEFQCRLIYYRS